MRAVMLSAAAAALAFAPAAKAQDQGFAETMAPRDFGEPVPGIPRLFAEAGVSVFSFSADGAALSDDEAVGGTLRVGLGFTRYFAGELDVSFVENASFTVVPAPGATGEFTATSDPDQVISGFARADLPFTALGDRLVAHGRFGFARVAVDEDVEGGLDDQFGVAFGLGARLAFTDRTGLRLDYTRLELEDTPADAGTLAFSVRF